MSTTATATATTTTTTTTATRVIDSHLHVWANTQEADNGFPYSQEPPENLKNEASYSALLKQMDKNDVDGALIVQPINHKFDHSYVLKAMASHPGRFKGMMLHDPSMEEKEALASLEDLSKKGFVGVRFNPYLWPSIGEKKWSPMSKGAGLAVYRRCGELNMPVGIMCFQGVALHYDDMLELLKAAPDTTMVIDHFGFTSVAHDPEAFEKLLALAKYPQVFVKISALFRLDDPSPFNRVRSERFEPLLKAFGAERLLYGSDFPFVLEQSEAYSMVQLVASWIENESDRKSVMGGTAERIFGQWSATTEVSSEL